MTKFSPKHIGITQNPIIIVGEKPGTTRDNSTLALSGNRTGDFVHEAIGDRQNIILTNIVNEYYSGSFDHSRGLADGILELIELIETYKPSGIITLGQISHEYTMSIVHPYPVWNMPHPSYINRFYHSLRGDYIKRLQNEIDKRISVYT